jgi:lysine 2,3-aminomutase
MGYTFPKTQLPPDVNASDWADWRWQMRARLLTEAHFAKYFDLSDNERVALNRAPQFFKVQSTPYYASLADRTTVSDPIRRMIIPSGDEFTLGTQQMKDPLGERRHSPTPRLVHRYPDRVLFLVTDTCSVYCRYCLRKHFTGQDAAFIPAAENTAALEYIRSHPEVREVILSGGDPLTLGDDRIVHILTDLRAIPHVDIIRLGTRMPVVSPMRMTEELIQRLKRFHPVFVMTHFNHPNEVTLEAAEALSRLVDNGFPVFNQMVLLKGINNSAKVVQELARRLLFLRVKPYYMFQCDPSEGTDHFRTSIEESLAIQKELWGRLSGLAMANLSLDIPGGGGKVGLVPDFTVSRDDQGWTFKGFDGYEGRYENPTP